MGFFERADRSDAKALPANDARVSNSPMVMDLLVLALRVAEVLLIIGIGALLVQVRSGELAGEMAADHYRVAALGALIYSALAAALGAYDLDKLFSSQRRSSMLIRTWGVTAAFLVSLGFVLKASTAISREWALVWFFGSAAALWLLRSISSAWLRSRRRAGHFDLRTAVFGGGAQASQLISYLNKNDELAVEVVGRFNDLPQAGEEESDLLPSRGDLSALIRLIRAGRIDQVFVALPWAAKDRIQQVVQKLALTPVRIRLAPDLAGFTYMSKPITLLGELPVITLFDRPISGLDQSIKWLEDKILGWLLLILLAPLFVLIAIAIKLDSRGPVFFRQPREGFNDGEFHIWKFRSMSQEASEWDSIHQASRGDPRVTRVGAFLRRFSLDELPQLFNVVSGEMSLVGPRPHAPSTRAGERLFRQVVSTYAARHRVKPGMTGWAQVRGWRGLTDTEEKLQGRLDHDLHYIEHWSLWFDLWILARTAGAILNTRNAF